MYHYVKMSLEPGGIARVRPLEAETPRARPFLAFYEGGESLSLLG